MLRQRALAFGLCVLALSVPSASAADGPSGGVVVGANISSAHLAGSDATGINSSDKTGLFAGVFALWPIAPVVTIQPEVAYSQRRFLVTDTVGSFSATEKWDWVEVPILARVALWRGGRHAVYAVGGPGFAFLMRAKEEAAGTSSDVKDDVKHADVSIIAGAGLSLGKFGVEARYDAGLKDLNKDNSLGDDLIVKSRTVRVDLTWMFR
jgi:outer membrane protein with beta-barrel domain